jgi:ATP-dependent DNA helicase PIF1
MELSTEQIQAMQVFEAGGNMFMTGPGGTGKTALIRKMVDQCKITGKKLQVCALTGCAAVLLNCQAKTVHSWAGIGLANGPADFIVKRVVTNKYKAANWKKIDVLIIDEVSMMSRKIFELLDSIARNVRKNTRPFGGLQVIFSGDFYQLPPVDDKQNDDPCASAFCFESPQWAPTFPVIVQLKKIFRQTDDIYTGILNQIRVGKLFKSALDTLTKHIGKDLPSAFVPTILLPRRRDAELINAVELEKLPSEKKIYTLTRAEMLPEKTQTQIQPQQPQHSMSAEDREMEYNFLTNNIMADKEIVLKKGAQVMCIANIDMESTEPIVNGSQGKIIDFVGNLPLVQFNNGVRRTIGFHTWNSETFPSIGVKQIPLIYAWAITIHKAQGVSLDMAQIDAGSNIFECGQTYVALSRIKSLEGLYLTAFNAQKIKVNKKVQDYYKTLAI